MNARNVNVYVIAATLFAGCADDLAARDYTAEACPTPPPPEAAPLADPRSVCDRGRGQSPRFVTIRACLDEMRLRAPKHGWGGNSTSPIYARCWPAVLVHTMDDVRAMLGLIAY